MSDLQARDPVRDSAERMEGEEGEEYVNPADKTPRWLLTTQVFGLRSMTSVGMYSGNMASPPAPAPTRVIWLDSTLSAAWPAKEAIRVDIWDPDPDPDPAPLSGGGGGGPPAAQRRPAVINFHGGGFCLGAGTDDSRWAGAVTASAARAVVLSVSYRLAPGYPHPTAVEDCADAIVQICARADELGIDAGRVALSGFSAGATLSVASWVVLQDPGRWSYYPSLRPPPPRIAGMALFYPLLDRSVDRPAKRAACARPDLTLAKSITDLTDASYVYPPLPRARRGREDPRLSPGLMPDGMLAAMPPVHLCLCEHDMVRAEGEAFARRLQAAGRPVGVRVVPGEQHAWDKPPPLAPKESVATEYAEATKAIASWFGEEVVSSGEDGA